MMRRSWQRSSTSSPPSERAIERVASGSTGALAARRSSRPSTSGHPPTCDDETMGVRVFLVDGTYEMFRYHFALPSHVTGSGQEVAATRGVLNSVLQLFASGATHVGVATDHVIESFRNEMFRSYKSSAGMPPELLSQFQLIEDALEAMGVTVWPMVELEADDGLASVAAIAAEDPRVEQVVICTPDKDLGQCVRGGRVVQLDRRKNVVLDEPAVEAKFGVLPESIPDYLGLVGDSSDGYPGLPAFGAKTTAALLHRFVHLEDIPKDPAEWKVAVRGAATLAATLFERWDEAMLYRDLATLRIDRSLIDDVAELEWRGPRDDFAELCHRIDADAVLKRSSEIHRG